MQWFLAQYRTEQLQLSVFVICLVRWPLNTWDKIHVRPKKNPVFRATRSYLSELADPRLFFTKIPFFFSFGFFIIEVSILKKTHKKNNNTEPTLSKVFKTVALNTRFFFFWPECEDGWWNHPHRLFAAQILHHVWS